MSYNLIDINVRLDIKVFYDIKLTLFKWNKDNIYILLTINPYFYFIILLTKKNCRTLQLLVLREINLAKNQRK